MDAGKQAEQKPLPTFPKSVLSSVPQVPPVLRSDMSVFSETNIIDPPKLGSSAPVFPSSVASSARKAPKKVSNTKPTKGKARATEPKRETIDDYLLREIQKAGVIDESSTRNVTSIMPIRSTPKPVAQPFSETMVSFRLTSQLLMKQGSGAGGGISGLERDITQAPLLSGNVIAEHSEDLVPQIGLMGCLAGESPILPESQIFQNTNTTFSAFICGVQGSGKSYTTATMIENAIIKSPSLGRLRTPASALVFSYGRWANGGAGFNISEVAYLVAANPAFPGLHAKKITVLVSPSNRGVANKYTRLPNVNVFPFKLNPRTLDGDALKTLMCVDERANPLYMAKVEAILREISSESENGILDYRKFKTRLADEKFDPTQRNMLDMRLNLLESFLDMTGYAFQPQFEPGEITIMDLTDPFISASTACILFKIGMDRFIASSTKVQSKMIVLDEAHKYMTGTSGSVYFTDNILRGIREQRHDGLRVIISTQEPTISTALIALCSITIIHRFSSPTWAMALRAHITAMDDRKTMLTEIEGLETGEAFVFAPSTVLGKNEDGSLIKATGRLLKIVIRRRVTSDGGETIMAV